MAVRFTVPAQMIAPNRFFVTLDKFCGKGNFDYEIDERAHFQYDG